MKFQTLNVSDWRQAILRNPPPYRIGSSTVRLQSKFIYLVVTVGAAILLYFYIFGTKKHSLLTSVLSSNDLDSEHGHYHYQQTKLSQYAVSYNDTYPLSPPLVTKKGIVYKIYVIADLDTNSKSQTEDNSWISYLKVGFLTFNPRERTISIEWSQSGESDKLVTLTSTMSCGGRGMELSELVVFNGKLYTVDDRTGIIYELDVVDESSNKYQLIPWVILPDGNGKQTKGGAAN